MRRQKANPRKRRHSQSSIESLAPRRMLATFTGTAGADTIILGISPDGTQTHVVINGNDTITGDQTITVNCGAGGDSIQVVATRIGSTVTINGEGGGDTLENIG